MILDPNIRLLMQEVAQGDQSLGPYLFQMQVHSEVTTEIRKKLPAMLYWLIKNGLVGQRFKAYVEHEHGGSVLKLVATLRKKVSKEKELREIYADKTLN